MTSGCIFFFSSRRRHTRLRRDWSSDVCSSDLVVFPRISSREHSTQHHISPTKQEPSSGEIICQVTEPPLFRMSVGRRVPAARYACLLCLLYAMLSGPLPGGPRREAGERGIPEDLEPRTQHPAPYLSNEARTVQRGDNLSSNRATTLTRLTSTFLLFFIL